MWSNCCPFDPCACRRNKLHSKRQSTKPGHKDPEGIRAHKKQPVRANNSSWTVSQRKRTPAGAPMAHTCSPQTTQGTLTSSSTYKCVYKPGTISEAPQAACCRQDKGPRPPPKTSLLIAMLAYLPACHFVQQVTLLKMEEAAKLGATSHAI